MDIKTLESFRLEDAVHFHDELNPKLWDESNNLLPSVKKQLLIIAEDFISELGIKDLAIEDITISGSNAAYSYTPHSDLDLHILVDFNKLSNDSVYQELFTAKKNLYNDSHDITINDIPVELYVQDSNKPSVTLGEYSVIEDKWLRIPSKRRASLNHTSTRQKYNKLLRVVKKSLRSTELEKINNLIETIHRYRRAGLTAGGEFSPENLAYKVLRKQGFVEKLYQHRDKLHSLKLSIEENKLLNKLTPSPETIAKKHGHSKIYILKQLNAGISVELEHTTNRAIAREIALDHLAEDPNYYAKLRAARLEENTVMKDTIQYSPYFTGENLSKEESYLNSVNGKVSPLVWIIMLETVLGLDVLNESLQEDILNHVLTLKKFCVGNPRVGVRYIPIPIILAGSRVYVMDCLGNEPPIHPPKLLELLEKTEQTLTFECDDELRTYPFDVNHLSIYSSVLVLDNIETYNKVRMLIRLYFEKNLQPPTQNLEEGASGYIPSKSESNDPRYSSALTVDVRPDTMRKNAKKFGNKISRSGIPPTLKTDGRP